MAKLVAAAEASRSRVSLTADATGTTLRQLHDCILGHKLELLRYAIKAVTRSLELTSPDGAAALELVLQVRASPRVCVWGVPRLCR